MNGLVSRRSVLGGAAAAACLGPDIVVGQDTPRLREPARV